MLNKIIFTFLFFLSFCSISNAQELQVSANHKKLRFFVLDYHSSATQDIIDIFQMLGHQVVYWTISPYSNRIHKHENHPVEIINQSTWLSLNAEMCEKFYQKYKDFLAEFDCFIVTSFSSFGLIYEKFDKPIIIINSARYEIPFTNKPNKWELLNEFLINGVKNNKIFLVANNKADIEYLKYYTGLTSVYIPSLCSYTNAYYSSKKNVFICYNPRNKYFPKKLQQQLHSTGLVQEFSKEFDSWQELYDFKGIIHFPYQISTMSLFEQYTANIPLFFPSKDFLFFLQSKNPTEIMNEISFFWLFGSISPIKTPGDLNNLCDPNVIKFWIDFADFYDDENMPYIQYFQSFEHLEYLLRTVDTQEISNKMKKHNLIRKNIILEKWKNVLEKVSQFVY